MRYPYKCFYIISQLEIIFIIIFMIIVMKVNKFIMNSSL